MILNLVKIINQKTHQASFFAVNNKHYDSMLAAGDISNHDWSFIGDVEITEEILNEQGYFHQ